MFWGKEFLALPFITEYRFFVMDIEDGKAKSNLPELGSQPYIFWVLKHP